MRSVTRLQAVVSINVADGTRSIVTSNTMGTGPDLGFLTFLALGGSRLFAATGDFEPVVLEIVSASGNRTVISGNGVGSGSDFLNIQGLAAGSTNSAIYIADFSGDLFAVDPSNGARTIVSPAAEGLRNGAVFEQNLGMQLVEGNDMVLVSDCQHGQLLGIDPSEGARSILTPPFRGDGPPLIDPMAMALRQDGGTLITMNRKGGIRESTGSVNNLISVDTMTGNRAIVSNAAVGSGDLMMDAFDLVEDNAHGRYLITDSQANAIIAIDPDTGDRAILSDNVSHGIGVPFLSPHGIAIDSPRNRAVVADTGLDALIGVDLETGDRTIITQVGGAGSGDDFNGPVDVELDMAPRQQNLWVNGGSGRLPSA
jgi:DNA-binding beta-propeller fold protein YncE